jgi:hypothetical protein
VAIDTRLQQLLETPTEHLDVELKAWLDLAGNGHRGTLAKGLIALANHGGGIAIIGFDSDGNPAPIRPATLAGYSQDAVNDVVDRFADPGFHCTVRHLTRAADGLQYPVILVPGGHKAPIRSKRGSPGNEIHADRYYIRRPGPASEPPQGGHEWNELIRRCVRNSTDEIASLIRDVLEGRAPKAEAPPDAAARLAQWDTDSVKRWRELTDKLPPNSSALMPHGHYRVACIIEGMNVDLPKLQEIMRRSDQHLTGWPPWWWPTRKDIAPYVEGNTIECHLADQAGFADAAHADFWRVSTTGELVAIRGYIEDSLSSEQRRIAPGTVLDLTLPVWRVGECLMFIQRFAIEAGLENSSITVRCDWNGLRGRSLTVLSGQRFLPGSYTSRTDGWGTMLTTPVERIAAALPEIVRELVQPLFALFDFFQPPLALYSEELERMLNRKP